MGNRESKQVKQPAAAEAAASEPSNAPRQASLGEWESPITSASIAEKAVKLRNPFLRASDGALFWLELRPSEGGRQVLVMRSPDGAIRDVTPPATTAEGFNVRTTVYEYGGGEYCIVGDTVYFTNFKDQALYAQDLTAISGSGGTEPLMDPQTPRLVTHGSEARGERFADGSWDENRQRLVLVSEVHKEGESGRELPPGHVVNRLVAWAVWSNACGDVSSGDVTALVSGANFYSYPAISPSGRWLAWVQWDFPNMPWDHTTLLVAPLLDDGTVGQAISSYLYFVDDKSGWWNLYRCRAPVTTGTTVYDAAAGWTSAAAEAESLAPMEAEWGFPSWNLDRRSYQPLHTPTPPPPGLTVIKTLKPLRCPRGKVLSDGSVLGVFTDPRVAGQILGLLQPPAQATTASTASTSTSAAGAGVVSGGGWKLTSINLGMTHFSSPPLVRLAGASGGGSGGGAPLTVAAIAASFTRGQAVVQLTATSLEALTAVTPADLQVIKSSSTSQIPEGYISVPEPIEFPTTFDGKPTTAHMLYYPPTNKDFTYPAGVLPPLLVESHGGPTSSAVPAIGALLQYWTSRAPHRTAVRSLYSALYRIVLHCTAPPTRKVFSAGASLYGVADLRLLAEHTHKFESRYLDMMVGPLPDAAAVYDARSPLKHPDGFSSPVIFFQGDQDKVVPPEQAIAMYNAVKAAGLPTGLVMLAGEQHGFRQAVSIRTALEARGMCLKFACKDIGDRVGTTANPHVEYGWFDDPHSSARFRYPQLLTTQIGLF
ncbi:hypothetical protein VOLCADRAFT_95694 [Volvox carteri f. nagariensis]|uniref:Peptidase S9 prolyl oligopeptidase catalytic domain-containing protein n=1 Tax=Volvox carteri f. nagariensis TaxID=3068 RepID=D8U852_VOLCA|nr:uncharacterized protein VOLCADRAFT_95694 [Volvox carteri f. nagariensis]EFJ44080.1 hypothetical protein VOLCADRAFT_95694 [Volvox carteri f. nagariensis]|eukprot:XP_002954881.1 hypothetical protein VOLCADRAFT_95694 [Volvox carteri f. nagariensis]